jgi:hypothetical protein
MVTRRSISPAVLMGVVVVLALDFAWFRAFISHQRSLFGFAPMGLDFGIVPMGSLLAVLGGHVAWHRRDFRPFATGFLVVGTTVLMVYGVLCLKIPAATGRAVAFLYEITLHLTAIESWEPAFRRYLPRIPFEYSQILWVTIILTVPQLLIATAGGLIVQSMVRRSADRERSVRRS